MDWSKIHLPPNFLNKAAVLAAIAIFVIIVIRLLRRSNKIFLSIFLAVGLGVLFFSWVYNRNEPEFMTWLIKPIADSGFFPSKGTERPQYDPLKKH
jgi:hypothetical protein